MKIKGGQEGCNLLGDALDYKMVKCQNEWDQREKGESNPFVQNDRFLLKILKKIRYSPYYWIPPLLPIPPLL